MSRPLRFVPSLLGSLVFLLVLPHGLAAEKSVGDWTRAFAKLERGMTPERVRQQVGAPKRIARQILSHRHLEQWIYDSPRSARIQFDCPRGQQPQLVWKHQQASGEG